MFIALDRLLRRQRRRLVLLAVVLAVSGAVVAAHSVMADDHMPDGAVMCLAVMQTAILGFAAVAAVGAARGRWSLEALPCAPGSPASNERTRAVGPLARAGPSQLQVFRF